MRPETMGWHDAAGIADFPGDIDSTDETTAAPGMVFTPSRQPIRIKTGAPTTMMAAGRQLRNMILRHLRAR